MQQTDLICSGPVNSSPCPGQDSEPGAQLERIIFCPPEKENPHPQRALSDRRICLTTFPDQSGTSPQFLRESVGGKGMFLHRMQTAGLRVPEFQCVTTDMVEAIEQHALDTHRLSPYIPGIADELTQQTSLADIKAHIRALPSANQDKRTDWLAGLSQFIASHDFYELVKDSEAVREIRRLEMPLAPVIVRSSGINEDNYGDAQAGKYLSEVQGDEDVLRTCLKVMASGYRPDVCTTLQPMALIIQHCIDCRYGGVAMSYQSLQDDTIRVEYAPGQPRGAVSGLSDTHAHRIDIGRGTDQAEFTPGEVSSRFILQKSDDGYTEVNTSSLDTDGEGQRLSDGLVAELRKTVTRLEDLLLCPVDVEFAIDHQDRLFLLQVRPVTRLSGGMEFAMPIPRDTLASGEGVSEGYCTGTLWSARNQWADIMPEGAIIVARHGEPWMLEPEYLGRAAGFVFAAGGSNDHVAITLRQAGKPCLLAGEHYSAVTTRHGQQATLVCARFNETPEAFIVEGDLSAQLTKHRTASSASEAVKLPEVQTSRDDLLPGTFDRVDAGFRWLTEQNARLLAFFAPGGGLDCLSDPITLSMSAQRSEILAAARASINQLVQGAEALLHGYQAFLQPAGNEEHLIKPLMDELPELISRFGVLKQTITSKLDKITSFLNGNKEPVKSRGSFQEWLATCQQLQSCLQELDPYEADQIQSVHDLIFALHKRFVDALGTVASVSGQGRITEQVTERGKITCVDYIRPGEEGLLRASGKKYIEQLSVKVTLINMVDALIINLRLGMHVAAIELHENAEGGKGRTLRLKFSDVVRADGSSSPGKLKRMWFLVQLLKATGVNKDAGDTKVCINGAAGKMIVEYSHIVSRQAMQDAFERLTALLNDVKDDDSYLAGVPVFEGNQWDFTTLAQRLGSDGSTQADRFAFNQCLFSIVAKYPRSTPSYYRYLSDYHQQFFDHAQRKAHTCSHEKVLMGNGIDRNTRRELLHHLLLTNPKRATPLLEQEYDLQNKYFVLRPSHSYDLDFHVHPDQTLSDDDRAGIGRFLLEHGFILASKLVRDDKDAVLPRLKEWGRDLKFVSERLKRDKEVVMAAVSQSGHSLFHASPEIKDDIEVVRAAINGLPEALKHASERIRSDKEFIQTLVERFGASILCHAGETLLNDREYMLSQIEDYPYAYTFRGAALRDRSFEDVAIQRNPWLRGY